MSGKVNPQYRQTFVFDNDHPTPDGTPIRDYIRVADLGVAHILALDHLRAGQESERINLDNGRGYSVMEVIDIARQVTGRPITVKIEPRRAGDPSRLVADAAKARKILGWQPDYPDLASIFARTGSGGRNCTALKSRHR